MPITDLSTLIAASKTGQELVWKKTATRVSIANLPFSVFDLAGIPGAGTLTLRTGLYLQTQRRVILLFATLHLPVMVMWALQE